MARKPTNYDESVQQIDDIGGAIYEIDDGSFACAIPYEGEWIYAIGPDLSDIIAAAKDAALAGGLGVEVTPYFFLDEVVDRLKEDFENATVILEGRDPSAEIQSNK